jgi:AsmA protein
MQKKPATENPKAEPGAESPLASSSDTPENQSNQTGKEVQKASSSATATDQPATAGGEPVVTARRTEVKPQTSPNAAGPKPPALDAQGEIHLDWFFYNKLVVSNVACQLMLQDGKLQLKPLSASIYGGGLQASLSAAVGSLGPPFECRIYSENVLLDEIIGAFWPKISGSWSGNVNHISRAKGIGSDLKAIEFHTDLNINEAEFSGHPLLLKLAELFQTEDLQQLRFSQVTARIITSDGIATIKRLHLVGPILQVEGGGTAGLMDKKLDLTLQLQIQPQYVGKLAALREIVPKISDAEGLVQLPLNLGGTFNEPVYALDEGWLARLPKEAEKEPAKKSEEELPPASALGAKDKDKLEEAAKENAQ